MNDKFPGWWDEYSNQPYKLSPREKPRLDRFAATEYLITGLTALALSPALLWRFLKLRPVPQLRSPEQFVGLSVSPDPNYDSATLEMIAELGVRQVLVRIPVWDLVNLDTYARYIEKLKGLDVTVNIMQDKTSVEKPWLWFDALERIVEALFDKATHFQIGQAINRRKWGCAHSGEYLALLESAHNLRVAFPGIKLIGSSVIDFEPLVTLRTLFNQRDYQLDVVSALLYVNRRGSPTSRQFRLFDLYNKLRLIYAMVCLANRSTHRLWITETNWPLLNTKPYTPNSGHPDRTVDEPTQATYLTKYFQIAYNTGWVERVFWWQLINPGYGLVDHRQGRLRKMPSYFAFKELFNGALEHTS